MGIREEFEKAFEEKYAQYLVEPNVATWAAKWAMERCLELPGKTVVYKDEIRQLAKEME